PGRLAARWRAPRRLAGGGACAVGAARAARLRGRRGGGVSADVSADRADLVDLRLVGHRGRYAGRCSAGRVSPGRGGPPAADRARQRPDGAAEVAAQKNDAKNSASPLSFLAPLHYILRSLA